MATPTRSARDPLLEFEAGFHGTLLRPDQDGYGEARAVWNGMIDRRPVAIARVGDVDDVAVVVRAARRFGLPLAVRGGGHNVAGLATSEGGLVIDLSTLNAVTVDPERRRATVQGGAIWRDVDAATQPYGLAAPSGLVSETGVAGLTLGGGLGWLRRKHGLSCDNLVAADLVTAAGENVHTDEREHPELLWALRGGGGNFGVVTSFEFLLHPVGPEVALALVFYKGAQTVAALRAFRDLAPSLPPEIAPIAFTGSMAAGEGIPDDVVGEPMIAVGAVYVGPPDEGEVRLRPLRELAEPLVDLSGRLPYVDGAAVPGRGLPEGPPLLLEVGVHRRVERRGDRRRRGLRRPPAVTDQHDRRLAHGRRHARRAAGRVGLLRARGRLPGQSGGRLGRPGGGRRQRRLGS